MSRRRRRVKIKSSSRLFAFILFNLLLLATCITAHYQQQQQQQQAQDQYQGPVPILSAAAVATKRDQQQNLQLHLNSTTIPTSSQQEAAGGSEDDDDSSAGGDEGGGASGQQHELNNEANSEPLNVNQASINPNHHNHHYQHHNQLQQQQQQQQQQQSNAVPSIGDLCSSLPASSVKHLKLCKLISKSASADEAVALGAARGLAECRNQFKSERWNCTHSAGDHHLLTSKLAQSVGNRESAFVQAIAAAGIVHSIAHACSIGSLSDCACDKTRIGLIRQGDQIWKWGGCSNNIPHGMMFAKHLVDLLDAVHEHAQHQEQHQLQQLQLHQAVHHQLVKRHLLRHRRSLSSRHREPNQVVVHGRLLQGTAADQLQASSDEQLAQQQQQQLLNFCQKNQNISHTAQIQLIKSLLSKNSLERHQDFRLAMNMHNNRVGRMAVMKNMEVKCRCHGLSGSCSVKTCWLRLPDFQTIGTYLKRKYDSSIHLPTAINVNKLIPMMDRQEISAILLQNDQFDQDSGSSEQSNVTTEPGRQPEFAALTSAGGLDNSQNNINNINNNNFNRLTSQTLIGPPTHVAGGSNLNNATFVQLNATAPQLSQQQHHLHHLSYYERHKQLERLAGSAAGATNLSSKQAGQYSTTSNRLQTTTSLYLHGDEIQIVPMSQQQYQSLLRETKLCNNISNNNNNRLGTAAAAAATGSTTGSNRLVTRDLSGHQNNHLHHRQSRKHGNYRHKKLSHHHQHHQHDLQVYGTGGVGANLNSGEHRQHGSGSNLKYGANSNHQQQHLIGQLLHANKRDVDDLIHLHKSPDYCQMDARHGFAGVQARACSNDPMASNSCDKLCCGRGYETRETQIRYKCDCKFQYCCKIHCNYCEKTVVEYVCK